MNIEIFITRCFEIGVELLRKKNITKEEECFLKLLDELEQWILENRANNNGSFFM